MLEIALGTKHANEGSEGGHIFTDFTVTAISGYPLSTPPTAEQPMVRSFMADVHMMNEQTLFTEGKQCSLVDMEMTPCAKGDTLSHASQRSQWKYDPGGTRIPFDLDMLDQVMGTIVTPAGEHYRMEFSYLRKLDKKELAGVSRLSGPLRSGMPDHTTL